MKHLIYFTSDVKLRGLLELAGQNVATFEQLGSLLELDLNPLIGGTPLGVSEDLFLHLRPDNGDMVELKEYLCSYTVVDSVAVVFHSQSAVAVELGNPESNWREQVPCCAFPARPGRHDGGNGDGRYDLYEPLGCYLTCYLLRLPLNPAGLLGVWRRFETGHID